MATLRAPQGFSVRRRHDGSERYYWTPSPALRRAGWPTVRLPDVLGSRAQGDRPGSGALGAADAINAEVAAWRAGTGPGPTDRRPAAPGAPPVQTVQPGTLAHAVRLFTGTDERPSPRFARLASASRRDYRRYLRLLEDWAGDQPIRAITAPMAQDLYETLLQAGRHAKANAAIRVLRLLLSDAQRRGLVSQNVARRPGMIGTAPRVRIWTRAEIAAVVDWADALDLPSIGDAVLLAAYTGQRQGDLLRLAWQQIEAPIGAAGSGHVVRLKQGKRGALVAVPLVPAVVDRLADARRRQRTHGLPARDLAPVLPCELTGRAWVADTFRHRFSEAREAAAKDVPSLLGLPASTGRPAQPAATFLDLRDTAVTRLAEAGCTVPEISSITGHAAESAHQILRHYLASTSEQAAAAVAKLVAHEDRMRGAEQGRMTRVSEQSD